MFIGRVAGAAAVLGVGAFIGCGVASADAPAPGAPADASSAAPRGASATAPIRAATTTTRRPPLPSPRPSPRHSAARRPAPEIRAAAKASRSVDTARAALAIDPQLGWREGILRGTVGATSTQDLVFTLVSAPSLGGKLGSDTNTNRVLFGPQGQFSYLPYATTLTDAGRTETFSIMVAENTRFDQALTSIPLLGLLVPQALLVLHRTPILGDLLAPIIGAAEIVTFTVDPLAQAAGRPIAFTYRMPSFDGTPISINYYPATDVANGVVDVAPTVLNGPGLPGPGNTDPDNPLGQQLSAATQFGSLTPGIPVLRDDAWSSPDGGPSYDGGGGYNVISFDPRGEYASGGVLELNNPFYEGRDISAIITWATGSTNPARNQVQTDAAGDPLIGMVGGSYGGGIQLTAASTDPRIDAVVPQLAWNSLISSLYPNTNQFKTGLGSGLLIALAITGAEINNQIYAGVLTGLTLGWLSQTSQALLSSSGPTSLLDQLRAPTLLFQGMEDVLFPLQEALDNAQAILANPYGAEVKMVWFCGGHGTCLNPLNPYQDDLGLIDNLKWLDQYVAADPDRPADTIPAFQWYDQNGDYRSATLLPFQDGFNLAVPYRTGGAGGLLGIVPALGGSGPAPLSDLPFSIGNGAPAWNALNVNVTPPLGSQIVGAPAIAFRYTGVGTSRTVYAQFVDNTTGRVLGNIVTPIPVTLDGRERTVSLPMENIAYTAGAGDSLTLQITSSASGFENFTSFGAINISDIELELPIRAGL